jgi:hypothetical protein
VRTDRCEVIMTLQTQIRCPMQRHNTPAAHLLGIGFGLLALTAGGISLMINIAFGWKTSIVAAAVFGLSDGAKILLPMAAAVLGGWNVRRRLAWLVAVLISVAAALSSLLEADAQRIYASQASANAARVAVTEEMGTRQDLAAIKETLPTEALRKLTSEARAEAAREEASGGCGERCRAQKARYSEYLVRLGVAERRDALQQKLATLSRGAQTTPQQALGAADALATLIGGDKFRIATMIGLSLSIAMLIILELLASLSGDAALLLRKMSAASSKRHAGLRETDREVTAPTKNVANRAYYLSRLERQHPLLAARVHRGEISVYRACIQAGFRKTPVRPAVKSLIGYATNSGAA